MNKKKISSDIQNNIKLNKMNGELLSKAKISECFHHNKSECNGTIKKAHSIQRNGKLSLLEEKDENDNSVLYSFTNTKVEDNKLTLKPIGKAIASTFNGFCDFHDNKVFSPIEDASFKNTDEQCFLYSYRAFAHTHHRKTEQIKAYSAKTDFKKAVGKNKINDALIGSLISYDENEVIRNKLNTIIDSERYDSLEYLVIEYPNFFPIAATSSITPKYSPKTNTLLNNHSDPNIPYEPIFFNLIPEKRGSVLIMSSFPEDKKSILYLDEFESLHDLKQKKILTSLLIGTIENTFISPFIYKKLTKNENETLMEELIKTNPLSGTEYKSHFISKLNFFENRFIKNYT